MRTVPYQNVLHATARLLGLDPARDLNSTRAATLTEYLNQHVTEGWKFDWFPEWTVVELRQYRENYQAGEFLNALDQRYHIGSDKYYQALQLQLASTEAPATWNGSTWDENSAWWAELKPQYDAPDQVTGEALAVGDQRRDPLRGDYYQIHTAHTTSSISVDTTKAGLLTVFERYVGWDQTARTHIEHVKAVYRRNPRAFPQRAGKLNHRVSDAGVVVLPAETHVQYLPQTSLPNRVWVEFRLRPPQFTSTPWRLSDAPYDLDDLVLYNGGVFRSAHGNNSDTVDGAVNWIEVGFPEILVNYCKLAACADALTDQKQHSRKNDLLKDAQEELERVRDEEIGSQQEAETAEVQTYGT